MNLEGKILILFKKNLHYFCGRDRHKSELNERLENMDFA
jgi:hypothetical protein